MSNEKEMNDIDYLPKIEAVYKHLVKYVQQGININGWGDLPEVNVKTYMNYQFADEYYTFHRKDAFVSVESDFYLENDDGLFSTVTLDYSPCSSEDMTACGIKFQVR